MLHYMIFPYFVGFFIGTQIGKGIERSNNSHYHHTDKIIKLENKIKDYETLLGKMN
jgi:hypothetical protein